jgi:hypothetical protein
VQQHGDTLGGAHYEAWLRREPSGWDVVTDAEDPLNRQLLLANVKGFYLLFFERIQKTATRQTRGKRVQIPNEQPLPAVKRVSLATPRQTRLKNATDLQQPTPSTIICQPQQPKSWAHEQEERTGRRGLFQTVILKPVAFL